MQIIIFLIFSRPDPPTHQLSPRELDPKRIEQGFHDIFRVPPGTDPMNVSTEIYVFSHSDYLDARYQCLA